MIEDVPSLGYKTLIVKPSKEFQADSKLITSEDRVLENEFLKAIINDNGTINIIDKTTNQEFTNLNYFEDNGEVGHAWRYVPPQNDIVINTLNSNPKIKILIAGKLRTSYLVEHEMSIPVEMDEGTGSYITRLDADGDDAGRSKKSENIKNSDKNIH